MNRRRAVAALGWPAALLLACLFVISPMRAAEADSWQSANERAAEAYKKRDFTEAERQFRYALKLSQSFPADDPRRAISNSNLGVLAYALGAYPEAEAFHARALQERLKIFGGMHPAVAESLSLMGMAIREQTRFGEAADAFRDALAIYKELDGLDAPEVATAHYRLAGVLTMLGTLDGAEAHYRASLKIWRHSKPSEQTTLADNLHMLGWVLRKEGKLDEAESKIREAMTLRRNLSGPDDPGIASGYNNLAKIRYAQHRYGEAESLFRKALALAEKVLPAGDPNLAQIMQDYAQLLTDMGRKDEAAKLNARARAVTGG